MPEALKILLVDSNEDKRENSIQKLTDSEMYVEITQAKDAGSGLTILEKEKLDCMLANYSLPDMNGLELLNTSQASKNMKLPVIMLTDKEDKELPTK